MLGAVPRCCDAGRGGGRGAGPSMTGVDDGQGLRHLDEAQLEDWRLFLRAHAFVISRLEADLAADGQPGLAVYDVLVQLVGAPGHRLRMTELAQAVLLSRSGLTRLVDRMAALGYVRREPSPGDARGVHAVLTDAGVSVLRRASRTHLRGIGEHVVDRLTGPELAALGRVCAKLVAEQP